MKRTVVVLVAICIGLSFAFAQQQQDNMPRVDKREVRQQKRIDRGVKSGQPTPKKANRLEKQHAKIKGDEMKAKSDGKVMPRERARLTREQNKASRNIYRKKHNEKTADPK
jgi:uncharacterized protein HemX